jgi:predicted nuclease of predicted toxin-antitoxin system
VKILVDHNLPHWWAATLSHYCSTNHQTEVKSLRDLGISNASDFEVFQLAKDEGWIILTQDKFKNVLERRTVQSYKVLAYCLRGWQRFPMHMQLSKIFKVMPNIIANAKTMSGGAVLDVSYKNASVKIP